MKSRIFILAVAFTFVFLVLNASISPVMNTFDTSTLLKNGQSEFTHGQSVNNNTITIGEEWVDSFVGEEPVSITEHNTSHVFIQTHNKDDDITKLYLRGGLNTTE